MSICLLHRRDVELQRTAVTFRTVRLVRNEERKTQTDKRFAVRRHVDLQRGGHVLDNHARDHGDGVAAGRQFRVRSAVRHLLLLSIHGPDFRTEGERLVIRVVTAACEARVNSADRCRQTVRKSVAVTKQPGKEYTV